MMKRTLLIVAALTLAATGINAQETMKKEIKQTAGRTQLGSFAPEFARLNDDVLFGEVWNRQDELSAHDRSVVTIISLLAQGLVDSSFRHHLEFGKANGITKTEISEIITHAAFYAGWPKAWAAFRMAKEVWPEDGVQTLQEFQASTPWPVGEPNSGYAKYFTGQSWLAPMDAENGGPANVTFEPACRNNWHIHHKAVQVIVCVAGRGWYQEWGKDAVPMTPGTVIAIPAETKHWHGAAKDSWFQHLAYTTKVGEGAANEWLEAVEDEDYLKLE